ncbi:gastrula zinc finger protein XlCGF7.1-like [Macrobrachium nipponense]|uniref:gastrula zinc finger protein XlCGF7.1-like n=1 Tax=Macrobrachium nipponense TaxID=159736 RepID=UPI0030C8A7C4
MEAEESSSLLLLKVKEDLKEDPTENADDNSSFADPVLEGKAEPEFFYYLDFDVNCSTYSTIKCGKDSSPTCDDESRKEKICIGEENRYLGRSNTAGKRLTCAECQRTFSRIDKLKSHMRTHTGEKPYSTCSVCQKSFSDSITLKCHMKTHMEEKPYACSVCQKSFSVSSNLTNQMKTHMGEKSYTCSVCLKSFSVSSNLTNHMKTHMGEKPYTCSFVKKVFIVQVISYIT